MTLTSTGDSFADRVMSTSSGCISLNDIPNVASVPERIPSVEDEDGLVRPTPQFSDTDVDETSGYLQVEGNGEPMPGSDEAMSGYEEAMPEFDEDEAEL
eukprot:m.473942 g.473942  ORF g.473942 m.473942 type:complete len:99 (+) comp35258_c0_seq1:282-578(+)